MKSCFVVLIVLFVCSLVFAQNINQMSQPSSAYSLNGAAFSGADSSLRPTYWNGNIIYACKGLLLRDGCDSALIMLHLRFNDTDIRYPCKVGRDMAGYPIPIYFDRIHQTDTQVWAGGSVINNPLDSIIVFPESK